MYYSFLLSRFIARVYTSIQERVERGLVRQLISEVFESVESMSINDFKTEIQIKDPNLLLLVPFWGNLNDINPQTLQFFFEAYDLPLVLEGNLIRKKSPLKYRN